MGGQLVRHPVVLLAERPYGMHLHCSRLGGGVDGDGTVGWWRDAAAGSGSQGGAFY